MTQLSTEQREATAANVRDWLAAPDDPQPLLAIPPGRFIQVARKARRTDALGRDLLAFSVEGPDDPPRDHTRFMLPAHFAATRILDAVPGIQIWLQDQSASRDRATGRQRDDHERMFSLALKLPTSEALGLRQRMTTLTRILFNVPHAAALHERYGANYRFIVPAGFVLAKRRPTTDPTTQAVVVHHVRAMAGEAAADTLAATFDYANRMHGREMLT